MERPEIDLLQLKEKKPVGVRLLLLLASILIAYILWKIAITFILSKYSGNWGNYGHVTSSMIVFLLMILLAIFISHYLHFRVPLYIFLAIVSILANLNGMNRFLPIVDIINALIFDSLFPQNITIFLLSESIKDFVGGSFYKALLTWVIIDVPLQIWENNQDKEWETSVKYVYHSISNQILYLRFANCDNLYVYKQNSPIHFERIETFCNKKIKYYSLRSKIGRKNFSYQIYSQKINQYKTLLSLLQVIRSNPNHLAAKDYMHQLYKLEAILKRSKIINGNVNVRNNRGGILVMLLQYLVLPSGPPFSSSYYDVGGTKPANCLCPRRASDLHDAG